MSAYIIVASTIIDADKAKQYSQLAAQTVKNFGGEFLAKSKATLLAGESSTVNSGLIRFATFQAAEAWYFSEEYQAIIPIRDQAMLCTFKLVEGL